MTKPSAASESAISTPAQHTPGPWRQAELCICQDDHGLLGQILFVLRHPWGTDSLLSVDEMLANASLIAAAPDMLKALRLVERHHMASPHIGLIRAAIAKATGGRVTGAAAQHGTEEA